MIHYRSQARTFLKQAKAELDASEEHRLRYAALSLRFAIEALTYDRASAYKDELPPSEYETWQPRKLMAVLLEIDPTADKDSSIAVGVEEAKGGPAPVMQSFGTETVFNLNLLKKHYDAIGSHLHVPTLKQAQKSPPSPAKLRERCNDVADYLEKVLASPVWNAKFGNFASIECENCGATIRKRVSFSHGKVAAKCFECEATYTITEVGHGKVNWQLDLIDVSCGNKKCNQVIHILTNELKTGATWVCTSCKGRNTLALSVAHKAGVDAPE